MAIAALALAILLPFGFDCAGDTNVQTLVVTGKNMEPSLANGEFVSLYPDQMPTRFDVVAYEAFWDPARPTILGRVVGLPNEVVDIEGATLRIDGQVIADWPQADPPRYVRKYSLDEDEFLVLQDQRNTGDDSHSRGPVQRTAVLGVVKASGGK